MSPCDLPKKYGKPIHCMVYATTVTVHGAPVSAGTSVQRTKFTYIYRTMKVCMASFICELKYYQVPGWLVDMEAIAEGLCTATSELDSCASWCLVNVEGTIYTCYLPAIYTT